MSLTDKTLHIGDYIAIDGQYKRRSLKEFLLRKPRELQIFTVIAEHCFGYEYKKSANKYCKPIKIM